MSLYNMNKLGVWYLFDFVKEMDGRWSMESKANNEQMKKFTKTIV